MLQTAAAAFLIIHGLITSVIGLTSISRPDAPAMSVPGWLGWWPGPFGRSWVIDALHLGSVGAMVGGLLWLVAGLALVAAGAGWLGLIGPHGVWQPLALAGATMGLVALALYFHPFYLAAVVIDLAVIGLASGFVQRVVA
jgi:hypothetical protein